MTLREKSGTSAYVQYRRHGEPVSPVDQVLVLTVDMEDQRVL